MHLMRKLHDQHSQTKFDEGWKTSWLESFLASQSGFCLLAGYPRVIGYALCEVKQYEYGKGKYSIVRELIVDERFRNGGVGKCLISAVRDELRHVGVEDLTLDVHVNNKGAALFYEQLGFKKISSKYRMRNNG